jgi:hypothetical protein
MDELMLTEATANDGAFAYQVRKAAFREYLDGDGHIIHLTPLR